MEEHGPGNGGPDDQPGPAAGDGSGATPNEGTPTERKRRRRRSRSGRSGRRGRGDARAADATTAETPADAPGPVAGAESVAPEILGERPVTDDQPNQRDRSAKGVPQAGRAKLKAGTRPERGPKAARVQRDRGDESDRTARDAGGLTQTQRRNRRSAAAAPVKTPADTSEGASRPRVEGSSQRRRMQLTAVASRSPARSFWLVVGILTVAGLLVRLPGMGQGLWADEIFAVIESFRTPFPATLFDFPGDNKHPLYALLAHAALSVFGENPWSVRLPAVLFGVATIPLLYALGARITSRVEALSAAALLALSYHHVWFSQNARGYSMLAFFAVLTTLLLLRAARGDDYRPWIWYGLAAGLGAYTHLTFVFTVVAQFLVIVLAVLGFPRGERRLGWRAPFAGFVLSALVTVLLYLPMLSQVIAFFLHKESNLKGISSPSWALEEAVRVLRVGFGGALGLGVLVLGIGATIGITGAVSYARQSARTFLLLTLPAVVTVMGAFAARGTMYPRFFFLLVGFALLIGMRGMYTTATWVSRRLRWSEAGGHRLGIAMATAAILLSALSVPLNWRLPKQDFVGAMAYVEQTATPSDAIAVTDVTAHIYGPYYQRAWPSVSSVADLDAIRNPPRDSSAVAAARAAGNVWLIYTFPRYLEKLDAPLAQYVVRECTGDRVRTFPGTVGGGDVSVCRLGRS